MSSQEYVDRANAIVFRIVAALAVILLCVIAYRLVTMYAWSYDYISGRRVDCNGGFRVHGRAA